MACVRIIVTSAKKSNKCISPDGNTMVVHGAGVVVAHNTRTGKEYIMCNNYYNADCSHIALSPTMPLLAAGFLDGAVRVWDYTTGVRVAVLCGHPGAMNDVAFSPDGRLLASALLDKTVHLWRTDDWTAPSVAIEHPDRVCGVVFSRNNLMASYSTNQVHLWRITFAPTITFEAAGSLTVPNISQVAIHPEGNLLAVNSRNEEIIMIFNTSNNDVVHTLRGRTELVRSLVFSPCGRKLASGSYDGEVRLWDVATGACVRTLPIHQDLAGVMFLSNGKQLATMSFYSITRVWTLCSWSDRTHRLYGRDLKRYVFQLMCVRAQLPNNLFLPMEVWLMVMAHLSLCVTSVENI